MGVEVIKLDKAQTVCTIKNEKGEICSGHLKEFMLAPDAIRKQAPANFTLYRCKRCKAVYMAPSQAHLHAGKGGNVLNPQTDEEPELIKS
jgi:hypothetical protein